MTTTLPIPENRTVFRFGNDVASARSDLQLTVFEDESPPFAITIKTLTLHVSVFLTRQEVQQIIRIFSRVSGPADHAADY